MADLPNVTDLIGADVTEGQFKTAIAQMLMFMSDGGGMPSGGIIMWSGSASDIPEGWALCDGNNGTPNLQGRFVLGADSTHGVGTTGGSASGTTGAASGNTGAASGNTGATTLKVAQLPAHKHGVPSSGTTTNTGFPKGGLVVVTGSTLSSQYPSPNANLSANTGSGSSHTHTLNSHTHTLGNHTHTQALPPYYALCYIMKL